MVEVRPDPGTVIGRSDESAAAVEDVHCQYLATLSSAFDLSRRVEIAPTNEGERHL